MNKKDANKQMETNPKYKLSSNRRETLLVPRALERIANMYSKGKINEGLKPALDRLIQEAEMALDTPLYSVMDKKIVPPRGTKHDYMSLSIYTWPDPDTPDGLPYRIVDGMVNPEVEKYDRPNMVRMINAVDTLSTAYYITGNERYSEKAADLVRVWFLNPETAMNPNMLFAQYIPGEGDFDIPSSYYPVFVPGNNFNGVYVSFGGVIEGAIFPVFLGCIELLQGSKSWTDDDHHKLQEWFREYMYWLLESQHGKDEASTKNNHGSWYCTQVTAYAIFSNEYEIARRILKENVPKRIAMQIKSDGSQPSELERAISFHYVVFGLSSFYNLALLAEKLDVNLWDYETEDGLCLKNAIDWIMPYLEGQQKWLYPLIDPIDNKLIVPLLHMAKRAYGDSRYTKVIDTFSDYEAENRNRLLYSMV